MIFLVYEVQCRKKVMLSVKRILHFHRWLPVYVDKEQKLGVMSIGFLIGDQNDAVVWRGPKKNGKSNTSF